MLLRTTVTKDAVENSLKVLTHWAIRRSSANFSSTHLARGKYASKICYANKVWWSLFGAEGETMQSDYILKPPFHFVDIRCRFVRTLRMILLT